MNNKYMLPLLFHFFKKKYLKTKNKSAVWLDPPPSPNLTHMYVLPTEYSLLLAQGMVEMGGGLAWGVVVNMIYKNALFYEKYRYTFHFFM